MLSAVLAASLLLPQLDDAFPDPGTEGELELVSLVGTTHLTLVNPTAEPALVRLATLGGETLVTLVLPPRADRTFEFPRRTLAGTTLTLIAGTAEGPRRAGPYTIARLIESGYRALWFESAGRSIHAWGELPTGPAFVDPDPGTLSATAPRPIAPGPHVPVVTPANQPTGDLPPRIEPAPPPPV